MVLNKKISANIDKVIKTAEAEAEAEAQVEETSVEQKVEADDKSETSD